MNKQRTRVCLLSMQVVVEEPEGTALAAVQVRVDCASFVPFPNEPGSVSIDAAAVEHAVRALDSLVHHEHEAAPLPAQPGRDLDDVLKRYCGTSL